MMDPVLEQVRTLIRRLTPLAICDDCVAERVRESLEDVTQAVRELAGSDGFERQTGECAFCGAATRVTRHKG